MGAPSQNFGQRIRTSGQWRETEVGAETDDLWCADLPLLHRATDGMVRACGLVAAWLRPWPREDASRAKGGTKLDQPRRVEI